MSTTELGRSAPATPSAAGRSALRRGRAGTLLFVAAYVVAATGAQLLRQPGQPSWNTIWQEDGGIFLQQAIHESFPHALVHVYNSYLHVGPRLATEIVVQFPLADAARLISGLEALVVSLLSVYLYFASASVLRTQWARLVVAGSLVLLPAAGYETNTSLSDMHWYLTYAAFWAILANPRRLAPLVAASVVVGLAVLSDPLTGVLLPLALVLAWRDRRDRDAWVLPAVFVATLAIQLGFGFFANPAGRYAPSHWSDIPGIYALRVTGSLFAGDAELARLWPQSFGWAFAFATLAAVFAITAYGVWRRRDGAFRAFVLQCLAYSLLYLAVPCMLRGTANFLDRSNFSLNGSRYTVLPILFLVALVAAVLERRDPRIGSVGWRRIQLVAGMLAALAVLTSFGIGAVRSGGPSWRAQLADERRECAQRAHGAQPALNTTLPSAPGQKPTPASWVRIPVSPLLPPSDSPQPFAVTLSCSDLASR